MLSLRSNEDLFQFLLEMAGELRAMGEPALADGVERASRFSSGSPSEFLYEAKLALTNALGSDKLPVQRSGDIVEAIAKIDEAFAAVGGA